MIISYILKENIKQWNTAHPVLLLQHDLSVFRCEPSNSMSGVNLWFFSITKKIKIPTCFLLALFATSQVKFTSTINYCYVNISKRTNKMTNKNLLVKPVTENLEHIFATSSLMFPILSNIISTGKQLFHLNHIYKPVCFFPWYFHHFQWSVLIYRFKISITICI